MTNQPASSAQNLNLGDIYYILFRHKWKILLCSLAGFAVAGALYRTSSPPYVSEARLLVRYIVQNSGPTAPNQSGGGATKTPIAETLTTIMNTETELLNSVDLARDVATAFGAEKILAKAGGGNDVVAAAANVRGGLRVSVPASSPVIHLSFRHSDAEIVQPVLNVIVERYLKRHLDAHRSSGLLTDAQTQELDNLKLRLSQTEDELRRAMAAAGIGLTLETSKELIAGQVTANRREIAGYETEIAGRLAVLEELKKRLPSASPAQQTTQEPELPLAVLEEHRRLYNRVVSLRMLEQDLLSQFTEENLRVKDAQARLAKAEADLEKLRQQHPGLLAKVPSGVGSPAGPDLDANEALSIAAHVTAYQAKIKELNLQHEKLKAESARLDKNEALILDLRRKKNSDEKHYMFLRQLVDEQRMSEILGGGKVSNINQIQSPSPAYRERIDFKRISLCAVAGVLIGLAWAFLVELYLDRSVRRPSDLAKLLRVPLFLSIPKLKMDSERLALSSRDKAASGASDASATALVPADSSKRTSQPTLQLFHETLRDRLIGYFESRNLTHKPKLVAITSVGHDAGVTTTAAGLARSLSETGEGNVLLVDMTVDEGAAKQFVKGREACGLDELLEARSQGHVKDNLYVVTENSSSDRLTRNMPQRFARLIPKLKASDFDYIIFDMPVVSQLSITPRLAGFMDMVLLIVESETTDRDLVQGACAMLGESKTHVGVVLNKTRHYVPGRRNQELMAM